MTAVIGVESPMRTHGVPHKNLQWGTQARVTRIGEPMTLRVGVTSYAGIQRVRGAKKET